MSHDLCPRTEGTARITLSNIDDAGRNADRMHMPWLAAVMGALVGGVGCERADAAPEWDHPDIVLRADGIPRGVECAISRGAVACRGHSFNGVLGGPHDVPNWHEFPQVRDATAMTMGLLGDFFCVLRKTGRVACWGNNAVGQVGRAHVNYLEEQPSPLDVEGLSGVAELTSGSSHVCAGTRDGDVLCWGLNMRHQVSEADDNSVPRPTKIEGAPRLHGLTGSGFQTCGIGDDGAVWCWGDAITDGSGGLHATARPTRVLERDAVRLVDRWRDYQMCVVLGSGGEKCWPSINAEGGKP